MSRSWRGFKNEDPAHSRESGNPGLPYAVRYCGTGSPPSRGRTKERSSIPPALLPDLLADGAGDARTTRRGRNDTRLGHTACNFQHQLGADRLLELMTLLDRNDECARAADDTVLEIDVEVVDIHGGGHRPL